ncbi:MAG: protein phosphatase 2C domain-containing protein [Oscillatoriophycideae cyanobacterium NC_groundwater_1537_Pr4_S-0.65um_50_18]|nr:protein phosphatase 2C domain-containing protein [Oscillatoriophycideae cyanobacterium NC_groundwater_1537_Pr4_S-0.65um_50_18]
MQNAAAMLYCSNPTCQALNPEENKFCQKCRTPLVRQYLWALGANVASMQKGELLGDRYVSKGDRVFLDTKPGLPSANASEVPEQYLPYLHLSPLRLHVPQVYEWFSTPVRDDVTLLLDYAPLWVLPETASDPAASESIVNTQIQLFPPLLTVWAEASALRQLNWLWQMANLWQPLCSEQVGSSLLDPDLLRVEGGILRLLELESDIKEISLSALGELWLQWSATARPEITDRLQQISQQLIQGQLHNAELLVQQLDQAISQVAQVQSRHIQIATLSDQGPTRQRNEDACFPPSGTVQGGTVQNGTLSNGSGSQALSVTPTVIVCDGIGGHQGGDVASHLAIAAVEQRLQVLKPEALDAVTLTVELEKAICLANDQISQRNDSEQRFDRQRMGTTLVMGLLREYELYVTHIGDSRAYWITRWGCHQITLDDDVASREVRLGYSSYRQALQQPSSGSLVQALGMGASSLLYPSVQRFILDEDSIFLFCSDGLSDNERVDSCWDTEILPLLLGKGDLAVMAQRLVEIANRLNGYDNTTVGLLYCQVADASPVPTLSALPPAAVQDSAATAIVAPSLATPPSEPEASSAIGTQLLRQKSSGINPLPLLLGIVILASLGLGLIAALLPTWKQRARSPIAGPTASPSPMVAPSPITTLPTLTVGLRIQLQRFSSAGKPPTLLSDPQTLSSSSDLAAPRLLGTIPVGSTLEVLSTGETTPQDRWVQLRVCSTPEGASPETPSEVPSVSPSELPSAEAASPEALPRVEPSAENLLPSPAESSPAAFLQPGQTGWIREAEILPWVGLSQSSPEQKGICTNSVTFNPQNP